MSVVQTADDEQRDEDIDDPHGDPCPHCDGFLVTEEKDDEIVRVHCPVCHLDREGNLSLPEMGTVPTGYEYPWDSYDRYRVSNVVALRGVYPAIEDDDSYGLDDDSASYDEFVS